MPTPSPSTPNVSFEVFPPRDLAAAFRLWDTLGALAPLDPAFVSVTYGAGGQTRSLTHDAVTATGAHFGLPVAAHLTCVEASRAETLHIARRYRDAGVTHLVALRGDPPGGGAFEAHPDGFASSRELTEALARDGFEISVGAYPEGHPEAPALAANVAWLRAKLEAGASRAITQFFFEPESFFRFRDACAAQGIDAKLIPGILPVQNWRKMRVFAAKCGARVPDWLARGFERAEQSGHERLYATAVATELCAELIEGGVEDLHFYTLNDPSLSRDICRALGVQERPRLAEVA